MDTVTKTLPVPNMRALVLYLPNEKGGLVDSEHY